jgi:hypothetical protein
MSLARLAPPCRMRCSGSSNQCRLLALSLLGRPQRQDVGFLCCIDVPRLSDRDFHRDREAGSIGQLRRVGRSGLFPDGVPALVMFDAAIRTVRVTRKHRAPNFDGIDHAAMVAAAAYQDDETRHVAKGDAPKPSTAVFDNTHLALAWFSNGRLPLIEPCWRRIFSGRRIVGDA